MHSLVLVSWPLQDSAASSSGLGKVLDKGYALHPQSLFHRNSHVELQVYWSYRSLLQSLFLSA